MASLGEASRIGSTIRALRMATQLAQSELAKRAGISPALLSLWENGRREPTLSGLRKLAPHLRVPARLLFAAALAEDDDEMSSQSKHLVETLVAAARAQLLAEGASLLLLPHREGKVPKASRPSTRSSSRKK